MHSQASQRYRETDILTARPEVLLVRLLARAASRAEQGARATEAGNWEEAGQALGSAQAILAELRNSLDLDRGPLAVNLDQLYAFCQEQFLSGGLRKDAEALRAGGRVLSELHATWLEALKRPEGLP